MRTIRDTDGTVWSVEERPGGGVSATDPKHHLSAALGGGTFVEAVNATRNIILTLDVSSEWQTMSEEEFLSVIDRTLREEEGP